MALAITSLPVPVSPVMETLIFVRDTFSSRENILSMAGLFPFMALLKSYFWPSSSLRASTSLTRDWRSLMRETAFQFISFISYIKCNIFNRSNKSRETSCIRSNCEANCETNCQFINNPGKDGNSISSNYINRNNSDSSNNRNNSDSRNSSNKSTYLSKNQNKSKIINL